MESVQRSGRAEIAAIADASPEMRQAALEVAPRARAMESMEALLDLDLDLDGVVIATPSSLHAEQSLAFLSRGVPVFCQKPLGRDLEENRRVVECAREQDRLLGVDFCYRHTRALSTIRDLARSGELGHVYAMELTFHNAYGPDKAWFYDRQRSGGGCVMDLGVHLVDAGLWIAGFPSVLDVSSRLFAGGAPMAPDAVEDYALAQVALEGHVVLSLACSWNLPAGRDAVIEAKLFGTEGGAALRNVDGSFFDFVAERYRGTSTEVLVEPPDDWGGRAIGAFVARLSESPRFDPEVAQVLEVARIVDAIYARGGPRVG